MSDTPRTSRPVSRRETLATLGALGAATVAGGSLAALAPDAPRVDARAGRLPQSVARWCHATTPIDALCATAKELGMVGIDLLGPEEWDVPARFGLRCTMANSFHTIPVGFNRADQHDRLVALGEAYLPKVAAAGIDKVVVFSGNRGGLRDEEGIANCVTGFARLMPAAERHGVTLCLEMLNSKVDHRDYHADRTWWGVAVAKGVNHPRFRLLYDVYHMQVMEGDVIATMRANKEWIAHLHTAGVPGRHELDAAQELNYRAVALAAADMGFRGVLAHEFIPVRDGVAGLREAVAACTV